MLTQNSLQRLLEGSAEALDRDVAPRLDDAFAQMQVQAIRELLLNLAGRVAWRPEELAFDVAGDEDLITAVRGAGWEGGGEASDAIAWLGRQPDDAPEIEACRASVEVILQRHVTERARSLRSTMYRTDPPKEQ